MATLSSANVKLTSEQIAKTTGISAETLANWGLVKSTDTLTISELAEKAASDAQAKTALNKILTQNAQMVANGDVATSNVILATSEGAATIATGAFTTAIKANIAAMWTWMTTTPLGWLTLLAGSIFLTVKAYDALTTSAKEANEKIDESRSAYEQTTSEIESLNSELETTKSKIDELESKGTLSFTDKAELERLKEQNAELERSIQLQEKKRQNESSQTVIDIKQNKDALFNNFDKSVNNLLKSKQAYDEAKVAGQNLLSNGDIDLDRYENNISDLEKNINDYKSTVIDNIEKFEQYKEDIINKYGSNDISLFSESDRNLYNDIVTKIQEAYKLIYTDSEYNKFVIEPIFNEEKLKGLQSELLTYFVNGGKTDLSSLEEKFGSDIITALRNACEKSGIDFDKMIEDMYNNSLSKLDQMVPIIENHNNGYDAKQNYVSKQIRNYIQKDISEEDRTILLNAEIPDYVKFKTKQDVDNFIASLKISIPIDESDALLGISETVDAVNTKLKPSLDSLKTVYQSVFSSDGFTLNNVDVSMLESLKSSLLDLKENGIDVTTEDFENFAIVITDSSTNEEQAQKAFDQLATTLVNSSKATLVSDDAFNTLVQTLEQLGIINAEEALSGLKQVQEEIIASGYDLATMTEEQAEAFINEGKASEIAVQYLQYYMIQKHLAEQHLNTSADVQALEDLCNALGITGEMYQEVIKLKDMLNAVEAGAPTALFDPMIKVTKQRIDELANGDYEFGFKFTPELDKNGTSSTAKEAVDMLEKELAVLDRAMEAGYLDFNDYINRRLGLIEDYYNKGKISADQYYSYLQKHYETELSYMDKVTNAVIRRLDKEKQSLEQQKEAINERYQKEIDALEKRKSILQEEADNLQRQRDLEKALYDLRRAEEQRTQKIYTADKGFNYVADPNAIRDAQDDVATKKLQIEIAEIDKAIKKLEEARDKEVEAIDQRIEKIEEYKEKWQQISEEFTQKQEDMIAAMVLGADWENDILNQRLDTLENFKDRYIALQQAIVDAAYQAAKAEKDASGATISDTSAGKGGGTSKKDNADKDNTSDSPDKDTPKNNKPKYFVLYKNPNTNQVSKISSFPTKEKAEEEAKRLNDSYYESIYRVGDPTKPGTYKQFYTKADAEKYSKETGYSITTEKRKKNDAYYVQKYHTGLDQGYVSKYRPISDDEKLKMFQKFSRSDLRPDEVPALLKAGELVMTQNQQDNILKNLQMTYALNSVPANNNQVVNHVTINCPNVTNNSGAEYLMKELNRLTLDALQFANKIH